MNNDLTQCPLFLGLTISEIESLLGHFNNARRFSKDESIAYQGEEYNEMLILVEGTVNGYMTQADGKRMLVHTLKAPLTMAPLILYAEQPVLPISIVAMNDCKVIAIPRADFTLILNKDSRVLVNYIRIVSDRGNYLIDKMRGFAFNSIRANLARYLLNIYEREGNISFAIDDSQQDLAERFSVTRPALANVIAEMTNQGILISKGKNFRINNLERLRAISAQL